MGDKKDYDMNNPSRRENAGNEGDPYDVKFKDLQKYVPFLKGMIKKLEASADKVRDAQLVKMKNLYALLSNPKKRLKLDTLEKCEEVLKKLEEKLKFPIPPDNNSLRKEMKVEKEDYVESPASPPKLDLSSIKSVPKIIPVERCSTVERDFSKVDVLKIDEKASLEASRERLKGYMNSHLMKDLSSLPTPVPPPPPPPVQLIPGLDMGFVPDNNVNFNPLPPNSQPPVTAEWRNLESDKNCGRLGSVCERTAIAKPDEQQQNKNIDGVQFRKDFDERCVVSPRDDVRMDPRTSHPPSFAPSLGSPLASPISTSLSVSKDQQETHGHRSRWNPDPMVSSDTRPRRSWQSDARVTSQEPPQRSSRVSEHNAPSQDIFSTRSSWAAENSAQRTSWGGDQTISNRDVHSQRSTWVDTSAFAHGNWKTETLVSPKDTQPVLSRFSDQSLPTSKTPGSLTQSEGNFQRQNTTARSLREKLGQDIDKVEKLGRSTGGALRALKSDPRFTRREDSCDPSRDADSVCNEEVNIRPQDSRRDPRICSAVETQYPQMRSDPRKSKEGTPLPHVLTSPLSQTSQFGMHTVSQDQWSHSRLSASSTNPVRQNTRVGLLPTPSTVIQSTFHWQTSTCTVKQTTAHALGYRYQPKQKQNNSILGSERSRSLKIADDKACDKRGSRRFDSKDSGKGSFSKDRGYLKSPPDAEELSSPLGKLYGQQTTSKSSLGYGIQNYKIPKLPKSASPPKDICPQTTGRPSDPRVGASRDPRLARGISRPLSPESRLEVTAVAESSSISVFKDSLTTVPEVTSDQKENNTSKLCTVSADTCIDSLTSLEGNIEVQNSAFQDQSSYTRGDSSRNNERSGSSSPNFSRSFKSRGRSSSRSRDRSRCRSQSSSRARSSSRTRAKSRGRSSSHSRERSRGRSSSRVRGRSRGRSRSNSSHSRMKSRDRSCSPFRAKCRDRSISRSRGRSRGRDTSHSRAKSRGRSSSYSRSKSRSRNSSRSREKSRGRSPRHSRAKSRGRSPSRSRAKSRGRSSSRGRAKSRGRSSSRSRAKSRGRSSSRSRAKSRGRSSSRSRAKSRGPSPSRARAKSKDRSLSRSRAKSRGRSPPFLRAESRGRSSSRLRAKSRGRSRSRSRAKSRVRSRSRSRDKSWGMSSSRSRAKSRDRSRSGSNCRSRRSTSTSRRKSLSPGASKGKSPSEGEWKASSPIKANRRSIEENSPSRNEPQVQVQAQRRSNSRSCASRENSVSSERSNESVALQRRHRSRGRSRTRRTDRYSRSSRVRRHRFSRRDSSSRSRDRRSLRRYGSRASSSSSHRSSASSSSFDRRVGRSRSRSPSREILSAVAQIDERKKNEKGLGVTDVPEAGSVPLMDPKSLLPIQKEVVESSSGSPSFCPEVKSTCLDNALDVSSSTSGNVFDIPTLEQVVDCMYSTNAERLRSTPSPPLLRPESSSYSIPLRSMDPKTTILEIIQKALTVPEDLIVLATSKLPEDKRAQVMEIFKEVGAQQDVTAPKPPDILKNCEENEKEREVLVDNSKICKKAKKSLSIIKAEKKNSTLSPERVEKQPKSKKRNELEKLHEDIREMFISKEVVTATGQRSCRIRKEIKSTVAAVSEEKVRTLKVKERKDDITDSDDSPLKFCKKQVNDPPTGKDSLPAEVIPDQKANPLVLSSESEDDALDKKQESSDSSPVSFKRKRKMCFPESESEPELDQSSQEFTSSLCRPVVLLEKAKVPLLDKKLSFEAQTSCRNVARRGRRNGPVSRDQKRVKQEVTVIYPEKDSDIDVIDQARIEDKDMSLIDTSNIIQVPDYGTKLTRQQLKLLKGPDVGIKSDPSTQSGSSSDSPENEDEVSKSIVLEKRGTDLAQNDLDVTPLSRKKRKLKRPTSWQRGVTKKRNSGKMIKLENVESEPDHVEIEGVEHDKVPAKSSILNELHNTKGKDRDSESDESDITLCGGHDDINYVFQKDKTLCKLCHFYGKNIVHHFVSRHPKHEVYVSRLPPDLSDLVKSQSYPYNLKTQRELEEEYSVSCTSVCLLKCVLCNITVNGTMRLFDHASTHTGEFRYGCKICDFKAACRKSVKHHMLNNHSSASGPCKTLCKGPPPMSILFGYLCSVCNFFQLLEENLKEHLKKFHASVPTSCSIRFPLGQQSSKAHQESLEREIPVTSSQSVAATNSDLASSNQNETPSEGYKCSNNTSKAVLPVCEEPQINLQPSVTPSDLSVFISTKHDEDDESKIKEKREQILKDAGEKIRDMPKLRSSISDRLVQRLNETSPSTSDSTEISVNVDNLNHHAIKNPLTDSLKKESCGVRSALRSTPARLNVKSSDGSERRFTRSLSRNTVSCSDSDSASIPDEMKAPLPASMLSDTLLRMQETLKENDVVKPSNLPFVGATDISSDSHFVSKEKSVRVGLVEAVVSDDGSENLLYLCRSNKCVFASTQAILFYKHTQDSHPRIPLLAPCSVCKEQSKVYRDLNSSFVHLVNNHLRPKTPNENSQMDRPDMSSEPSSGISLDWSKTLSKASIIRPRCLPGDTLSERRATAELDAVHIDSASNELPQLVISSVISLSKDHTPDGMPLDGPGATPSLQSSSLSHYSTLGVADSASMPVSDQTLASRKSLTPFKASCSTASPILSSASLAFLHPEKMQQTDISSGNKSPASIQLGRASSFMKDSECLQKMKTPNKLSHFFKCMGTRCSFSTDVKARFAEHYQKHLSSELSMNPDSTSKSHEWQRCSYCGICKDTYGDLIDHIVIEHSILKYQCSYCLYRAAFKENVVIHQKLDHGGQTSTVLECSASSSGKGCKAVTPPSSTQSTIQPYKCAQGGGCKLRYISADELVAHFKSKHSTESFFQCYVCRSAHNNPERLICHYSSAHQYRMYHCLHCSKAAETKDEICSHICVDHPDKELLVGARIPCPDKSILNQCVSIDENMQMCVLKLADHANSNESTLQIYPRGVTEEEATDINASVLHNAETASLSVFSPTIKTNVESLSSSRAEWSSQKGQNILATKPQVPSISFEKEKSASDSEQVDVNRSAVHGLGIKDCSLPTEGNSLSVSNKLQSLNKSSEIVDLTGSDLYLCGYSGCLFKAESSFSLKDHLLACDMARESPSLHCPHCPRAFKNVPQLMDHLPKHSVLRYMCSLCDFAARVPTIAITHLRQKHKGVISHQIVPLHPLQCDPDSALYSVRPKDSLKKGRIKVLNPPSNKSSFGPEDVQSLPSHAVFKTNVSCVVCNYSTKVRSNMIRHLEQHAQGCDVSPVPVVNPVPKRQEKMFDTMTNHAISSTIPVRRESNAFRVNDEPKFVPENKRYVCCAPACQYVTSDDNMLRHHIRVLHAEIFFYKCPHCPESDGESTRQSILLEKLGSHLRMHGSRLYSCVSCSYYHYQRHIVERHTSEKHPDQNLIRIIREPKPDDPSDTENFVGLEFEIASSPPESQSLWECDLCEAKGTRADIVSHVNSVHKIQSQFKCNHCHFRTSYQSRFPSHFATKHPNIPVVFVSTYHKCEKVVSEANKQQAEVTPPPPPLPPTPPPPPPQPSPVILKTFDSTPLWRRDSSRRRHLRGILFEENGLKPKELERCEVDSPDVVSKRRSASDSEEFNCAQTSKREKKEDTVIQKKPLGTDTLQSETIETSLHPSKDSTTLIITSKESSEQEGMREHLRQEPFVKDVNHPSCEYLRDERLFHNVDPMQSNKNLNQPSVTKTGILGSPKSMPAWSPKEAGKIMSNSIKSKKRNDSPKKSPVGSYLQSANVVERISSPLKSVSSKSILKPATFQVSSTSLSSLVTSVSALTSPVRPVRTPSKDCSQSPPQSAENCRTNEIKTRGNQESVDSSYFVYASSDDELVVDESAFEMDIEEVEDIDASEGGQKSTSKPSGDCNTSPSKSEGFPCKYKEEVGCNIICKTKKEAGFHEMKHWETKPYKCGHCDFQGIQVSIVKMHCRKRHASLEPKVEHNILPVVATIIPLHSKRKSESIQTSKESLCPEVSQEEMDENERLFRNIKFYRCLFCRLRETSLSRLLLHWRVNHRSQEAFQEDAPDGRKIVPFKFKEVKLGSKEKETMAFRCAICSKTGTVKVLKQHYSSRHGERNLEILGLVHDRLQCALCPRQFSSKISLNSHFTSAHPGEIARTSKVMKPSDEDTSSKLNAIFGCLYCLEHVASETDMVDHHIKFHSHLEPKYMEIEDTEFEMQATGFCGANDDTFTECTTKTSEVPNVSNSEVRSSAISGRLFSDSENSAVSPLDAANVANLASKRCVARKSTAKFRAVARKSTGGKIPRRSSIVTEESSMCKSDDSTEGFSFYGAPKEKVNEKTISCPVMFDGTVSRVNLATMSKFSNLYPVVLLEDFSKSPL